MLGLFLGLTALFVALAILGFIFKIFLWLALAALIVAITCGVISTGIVKRIHR